MLHRRIPPCAEDLNRHADPGPRLPGEVGEVQQDDEVHNAKKDVPTAVFPQGAAVLSGYFAADSFQQKKYDPRQDPPAEVAQRFHHVFDDVL